MPDEVVDLGGLGPNWTAQTSRDTPGWHQLSVQTDAAHDVDFVLIADEQFPFVVLDDADPRAHRAWDSPFTYGV